MSNWIVRIAIVFTTLMGGLGLVGWQFGIELIQQGFPGSPFTMKANTALCLLLAGLALGLLYFEPKIHLKARQQRVRFFSLILSGCIFLMGLLTLSQYLGGWDLGLDQWLFPDPYPSPTTVYPGRMGEITALNFVLLGGALLVSQQKPIRTDWLPQLLACGAMLVSLVLCLGYVFNLDPAYTPVAHVTSTAPHTTLTLIVLSLGVLYLQPDRGITQILTSPYAGSRIARRLLPWMLILPLLLNWFSFHAQNQRWLSTELNYIARTMLLMVLLTGVVGWTAHLLNQSEHRRSLTEQGLQELDRQFHRAIVNAPIPIMLHAEDGEVLQISHAWTDITGYTPEDIPTIAAWTQRAYGEQSETIQIAINKLYGLDHFIAEKELEILTHQGQSRTWEFFSAPIGTLDDGRRVIMSAAIDLTEHKQAEVALQRLNLSLEQEVATRTAELSQVNAQLKRELQERQQTDAALKRSEERLQLAFEASGEGWWDWDIKTNEVNLSPRWCEMLGYQPDELPQQVSTWEQLIHPDDRPRIQARLAAHLQDQTVPYHFDYRLRTKSGQWKWISNYGRVILQDDQGNPLRMAGTHRDVSDRRQAEALLQEHQALLNAIIEGSQDLIAALDLEFRFIAFNRAYHDEFLKIFNYDIHMGVSLIEALAHLPQEQQNAVEVWGRALAGEEFTTLQEFGDRTRQRNCYEITYSSIRDRTGQLIGASHIVRDVTAHRNAEQLLRESEERYRSVVTAMAEGVVLQQASGEITAWNSSAEQILGLTAEQLLGRKSTDLDWRTIGEDGLPFPGDRHPSMVTLRTGQPQFNVVMGICKADKITTWISINSQPLFRPEEPLPYAVVTSFTDITLYKQAEAKLRESEARFRSAFDDAAIGMALVALDGKFMQVNRSLCEIVGYSQEELLTLDFQSITHADDLAIDLTYAERLLQGQIRTYQMEKRYLHKQGHIVWILLNGSLVRDESEKPLYFIAQIEDISDRKQAEQALELQAVITRNIAEGVCLIRVADGLIVYTNPRFEQMFNYEPGELLGQPVSILQCSDSPLRVQDIAQTLLDQHSSHREVTYEVHSVQKAGTPFWCRVTTSVFAHPEYGNVLVAVQQDITQQKQVEEQIRASLREKEVLLKEIHHRVKNNLQIVDGLLKMQARRTQEPQVTAVLRDSESRIASIALVHEKLYRSADLANIDFSQYIRDLTLHLFESYNVNPKQVTLQTQAEGILLDIETAIPCGLIINELVSNTLKYAFPTNRQGEVTIALQPSQDDSLTLTVRDNGIGLPENFDLTNTRSLGMTLIQGLVEQLEGNLAIASPPGTQFTITFSRSKKTG